MVVSKWTYTFTHYSRSDSWSTSQNLNSVFIAAPIFTDTSDGSVNSAVLKIDANLGHYIRDARNGEVGFPNKINIYDRIKIEMDDGYGNTYSRIFDVTKKTPAKDSRNGTTLQLTLTGIEHWLQKVNYSKQTFALTAQELLVDLISVYNANKTTQMPTLVVGINELPPIYVSVDWGINEDSIYNRLHELADSMGASAANGGVLDYFDIRFVTSGVNNLTLNIFSSGNIGESKPSVTVNGSESALQSDGGLASVEGTMINAWGAIDGGSLPINFSRWSSRRNFLPTNTISLFPEYKSGYTYQTGTIIQKNGITYELTGSPTSTAPPSTGWIQLTTTDYYGNGSARHDLIQYSPWTKDNIYWKNSGANPNAGYSTLVPKIYSDSTNNGPSMIDGNMIINDDTTYRTYVDVAVTDPANISVKWLYGETSAGIYDGFRVLVNGVGSGLFTGKTNYIMQYSEGAWKTFRTPKVDMLVAVIDQARVYKFTASNVWSDISNVPNITDCFHPMDNGTTTNGISAFLNPDATATEQLPPPTGNNGQFTGNTNSAVEVSYTWTPVYKNGVLPPINLIPIDYYKAGAWLTLRFPLPVNTFNYTAGTHSVGEAYGGTATTKAPTTVDIQNMTYSHDGKRGFNNGVSSEDLGPINAISFYLKLKFTNTWQPPLGQFETDLVDAGDLKMRCVVVDLNDNVAYQDFVIPFNNIWSSITLPISGFQTTRNHRPRKVAISDFFPPQAVDVVTQFEWRHLKMLCIQTQESYDEYGRYESCRGRFGSDLLYSDGVPMTNMPLSFNTLKLVMTLDAFRFTKPLLVNSGKVTSSSDTPLLSEPDFLQRPDIIFYDQLKSDVLSELDRSMHPPEEFVISTEGKFDINFGDYFYYTDTETVERSDTSTNQIKLVAKNIEYSITKPVDGEGGFVRTIRGIRRFV